MIPTTFITIANIALTGLINILPVSTGLPTGLASSLTNIMYYINAFSYLLPVNDIFLAVGIVVGFEVALWGFRGFMWIWHKVPFIGR